MPNYAQGAQTRVFFGMLPAETQATFEATKLMVPPPDVVVTLTAAAPIASAADRTAGFQSLAVTALTGPIARGTPLLFRSGTLSFTAYVQAELATGATAVRVLPLEVAIPTAAVANHIGIIQMVGGTSANFKLEAEDESVMVFTDKLLTDTSDALSGFMDGNAKSAKWSIDYESLSDSQDITLARMLYAGANVTNGVKCYVRRMTQPPVGYRRGTAIEGFASIMGFEDTTSAEGIVKIKTSIIGRGAPRISYPSINLV
jgi:hypothetical protein